MMIQDIMNLKDEALMKKTLYRLEIYYKQHATESEREFLLFILNHTREAIEMDIHTLAKQNYCSASTIVRVCKKNGFKGFRELKLALMNDLQFNEELMQSKIENLTSTQKVIPLVLNENIRSIQNTYALLDMNELEIIIRLLVNTPFISLFGIGASFLVAKDFQQKFERISKKTFLYEDIHLQLVHSTNFEKKDLGIIFSYSGLTKEMLEIAHNIKERGGILIAVTKYGTSKLLSLSDYNLYVPNSEASLRISASSSRISQLCIVDILYHTYLTKVHERSMDKIISTNKLLEKTGT